MVWSQNYNPFSNALLSTAVAALPILVLMGLLAFGHLRAWMAALLGLGTALAVAVVAFRMPAASAAASAVYGVAFGLFPIGWIVINVMFLHALTLRSGSFEALKHGLTRVLPDPRMQLILVAFCFGGFIEGAAGFGAPVAITAAMLYSMGFSPLHSAGLSLIANTAPVAFGSVGIPITTLAKMTGLDESKLSAMAGRELPLFSMLVPGWIIWAYGGRKALSGVWAGALVAGGSFAVMQFAVSNLFGASLVDMAAGATSIVSFLCWARFARRRTAGSAQVTVNEARMGSGISYHGPNPWIPWALLAGFLLVWGTPSAKKWMDDRSLVPKWQVPALHEKVVRSAPVAVAQLGKPIAPEPAEFKFNWLSATGTGIFVASVVSGLVLRFSFLEMARIYAQTLWRIRISLLTIAAMLALGNVTKYSGTDATLGLAMARTGFFYPFFGTLLGWLGVALTGSDTASNVLFGSLQQVTAQHLGISPYLMCSANSTGGVMGKMIDAQSIVVAGTAMNCEGLEGKILRFVFWHSVAMVVALGGWIMLLARLPLLRSWVLN